MFYSETPYLQRHPYANTTTGFPSSRYPPWLFFRLSTPILTILTNGFTQALPTSDIPNLQALNQLKCWSTASHILLLRHYQTQPQTVRQHHIPTPFLVLPNL